MGQPQIPEHPLQRIAMSLSGGGYRAASFHLGSMAYLHRLRYQGKSLLENVKMISTVSGGTITGVIYAQMKQQGKSFEEIYDFIMKVLQETDLLKESISKLSPDGESNNGKKTKNFINAFSELYDKHCTNGETFGIFENMASHLECVVFNSTEFQYGIDFRFRNKDTGYFGNHYFPTPWETAKEVKLADVIASSSAFTGGFEPILWPKDFRHAQSPALDELTRTTQPLGLMDGGIYDNQGIESILLYNIKKENAFDLLIISDVASPYMDAYKPVPENDKGFRRLTIQSIFQKINHYSKGISITLILLAAVCFMLAGVNAFSSPFMNGVMLGLGVGILLLKLVHSLIKIQVRKLSDYFTGILKKILGPLFYEKLSYLHIEKLSFGKLEPLIMDRANSLIKLMMDVFLKVVRRLNYDKLYDNEEFAYRRVSNLIKELTPEDYANNWQRNAGKKSNIYKAGGIFSGNYTQDIGNKLGELAAESSAFGTTLWFTDKPDELTPMLDKLLATGQATMCYNMVVYLESLLFEPENGLTSLPAGEKNDIKQLYQHILNDWDRFKEDPFWLASAIKERREIPMDDLPPFQPPPQHIQIDYFSDPKEPNWGWPLNVLVTNARLLPMLKEGYWAGRFCNFYTSDIYHHWHYYSNIFLTEYSEGFINEDVLADINTDILIIIVHDPDRNYREDARILRERTNTRGIFYCHFKEPTVTWFNDFIVELTHNNTVEQALSRICSWGYFYISEQLNKESPIVSAFLQTRRRLQSFPNLQFPPEIIDFLSSNPESLRYDHESETANRLLLASRFISEQVSRWKLSHLVSGDEESDRTESTRSLETFNTEEIEPTEGEPLTPRLHVNILDPTDRKIIRNCLKPRLTYETDIFIGLPRPESVYTEKSVDTSKIFEGSTNQTEQLQIVLKSGSNLQSDEITLDRNGESTKARFLLKTAYEGLLKAFIFIYHKNRLIQSAVLSAPVRMQSIDGVDEIEVKMDIVLRQQLTGIESRVNFGAAIYFEQIEGRTPTIMTMSKKKPVEINFTSSLGRLVDEIRVLLEEAAIDTEKFPEDIFHPENMRLLRRLAFKGNDLYNYYFSQIGALRGPIQIITKRKEYAPLEFVYTLPAPEDEATLCTRADVGLHVGSCQNCFDKTKEPASHICPFGFWAFSEVIERHHLPQNNNTSSDYTVKAEPAAGRKVLEILHNALFACTDRIDESTPPKIKQSLDALLAASASNPLKAKDWQEWAMQVENDGPETLILVVHIEYDTNNRVDKLEIGTDNFLIQNHLTGKTIGYPKNKKPPFIILIGCEATKISSYGFDVSSRLMNQGAAIVISNFTSIRGKHAGPIVEKLIQEIKSQAGREISLGKILLRVKQYLLSEGIMASMTLIAHGDADWKIKC